MHADDKFTLLQSVLAFGGVEAFLGFILYRLRFGVFSILCVSSAIACSFIQYNVTLPTDYAPDAKRHIEYISYLAAHLSLPPPLGWQTQQAPLFYIVAAVFYRLGELSGVAPVYAARMAAVFFYYGALVFAALLLRRFVSDKCIYSLCLLTILFWPAGMHNSVKISNDIGEFFFACGFIYFLSAWLGNGKNRQLAWAMTFAGGGMATKGSGLLLIAVLACFIVFKIVKERIRVRSLVSRSTLIAFALLIAGSSLNFGRIYYWRHYRHADIKWMMNLDDNLDVFRDHVENYPYNYLYFSYQDFIHYPFLRLNRTDNETYYAINVLLKTILFDRFALHKNGIAIAQLLNVAYLLCLGCLMALIVHNKRHIARDLPLVSLVCMAFFAVLMVMSARVLVPVAAVGSGRYVYVIIVLATTIYGALLSWSPCARQKEWKISGAACLGAFLLLCLIFTLTRWGWPIDFIAPKNGEESLPYAEDNMA